jgi:MFS superfamily sulfate permease-like transporter
VVEQIIRDALQRNSPVYLAGLQSQPRQRFEQLGLGELLPQAQWFDDRSEAFKQAQAALQ